jgi:hypothetical protein
VKCQDDRRSYILSRLKVEQPVDGWANVIEGGDASAKLAANPAIRSSDFVYRLSY